MTDAFEITSDARRFAKDRDERIRYRKHISAAMAAIDNDQMPTMQQLRALSDAYGKSVDDQQRYGNIAGLRANSINRLKRTHANDAAVIESLAAGKAQAEAALTRVMTMLDRAVTKRKDDQPFVYEDAGVSASELLAALENDGEYVYDPSNGAFKYGVATSLEEGPSTLYDSRDEAETELARLNSSKHFLMIQYRSMWADGSRDLSMRLSDFGQIHQEPEE